MANNNAPGGNPGPSPAPPVPPGQNPTLSVSAYPGADFFPDVNEVKLPFVVPTSGVFLYSKAGIIYARNASGESALGAGFINPMTTLADLIVGGAAGAPARLGIGSTGQVLSVVGGLPTWSAQGIRSDYQAAVLQLHMDGVNGGVLFPDSSLNVRAATVTGVTTSTTAPKFGTASGSFPGGGSQLSFAAVSDLEMCPTFSIDFWVKTTQTQVSTGLVAKDNSAFTLGAWNVQLNTSTGNGLVAFYHQSLSSVSAIVTSTSSIIDGAWHHVALVGLSGLYIIFIDGVPQNAAVNNTALSLSNTFALLIGNSAGATRDFVGNIDEFRYLRGVSGFTQTFTPPSAAYLDG